MSATKNHHHDHIEAGQRAAADPFNIELQYQRFIHLIGLTEANMHPEQKRQLRQTFYGAWGQCLMCLRDDLSKYPEAEAVRKLESMSKQVQDFFNLHN